MHFLDLLICEGRMDVGWVKCGKSGLGILNLENGLGNGFGTVGCLNLQDMRA